MIVLVLPDIRDDGLLLRQAREGSKQAIGQIYRNYVDSIYQFARLRVGDPALAEDITATVFERMIQGFASGKGPRKHLRGWLFQVARSVIYDHYGKNEPLPLETVEQWMPDDKPNPEQTIMADVDTAILRDFIRQLSSDQQEILLLRFDQQLSLQETADIMGKNVNTVKTLQYRAVDRLRRMIEREGA